MPNCRERWRNIRGSFLRSLKKPRTGTGTNEKKKYYLFDHLQFILPFTKSKASTGNLETLDENSEEGNSDSQENTENEDLLSQPHNDERSQDANASNSLSDLITNENVNVTSRQEVTVTPTNIAKKRKLSQISSSSPNPVDAAFVEWLKNKKERDDNKNDDPNMSFLRSLVPDMRKMTDKQNRRFRQKVIGLVDEVLEDADIRSYRNTNSTWSTHSRTSAGSYFVACSTPSPNTPLGEWPVQEQRAETSTFGNQHTTSDNEHTWYIN